MRYIAAVITCAVLSTACGDAASPEPIDVSGSWAYNEAYGASSVGLQCSSSGTLNLQQSDETLAGSFSQQGYCTTEGGVADNSGSGALTSGVVDGGKVELEMGNCSYNGTISGPLANRLYGTVRCEIEMDGQQHSAAGSWEALR